MASHIVGYPRIGPKRELKFALESFWDGKSTADDLQKVSADLRSAIWKQMSKAGIKYIPSNTFTYYDQVLDTTAMLGAVPPRYGYTSGEIGFDVYFSMAKGNASVPAMEMAKWFDTNYHYIVPELGPEVKFSYASHKAVNEYKEAKALGVDTVPVLVGPVSYLLLSKAAKGVDKSFDLLSLLPKILPIYKEVITELKAAGATWIQLDEPVLVMDLEGYKLQAFTGAYAELESTLSGLNVLVETYFADIPAEAYKTVTLLKGVTAFGFDLVRGTKTLDLVKSGFPQGKYLFAGVVDGRNIWANDFAVSLSTLQALEGVVGKDKLVVSTSCSLLHTAVDLIYETKLDDEIKSWMAFAAQKVVEVNALAKALAGQKDEALFSANAAALASRRSSPRVTNEGVQKAVAALKGSEHRRATNVSASVDAQQKKLNLTILPTTTIGSFPQTVEPRRVRREYQAKKVSEEDSVKAIKEVADLQEELDSDILVHGHPERNDMPEYFCEQLSGFAFTANGWVQSYGSRCVKPPVIYGDVSRPKPMTVFWSSTTQSMTSRPMNGMLTAPVTILNRSFVRNDQPMHETCYQIALAIKDKVEDLEKGGIGVIQIDEAALREGLPLRKSEHAFYLDWAVQSFWITNCDVQDSTQKPPGKRKKMTGDRSEISIQIRRSVVSIIRMSYRWICNHPFLLSFVGYLYFLHSYYPLLFYPLVSASPVLVCTLVLLGTILSFGEPNIPEIEKERESVHEAALFRTEVSRDASVVERVDKSFTVESFGSTGKAVLEDGNDDADRLGEYELSEVEDDSRPFDYRPLIDETLDEVKRGTQVRFEEKAFILDLDKRREGVQEELIESGGKQVSGVEQSRNGGCLDELMDDSKEDQIDVSPVSPWRPMRHEEDEDDDADRDDSSDSDGAESSSPDASMTDIIPMLDELHPLLHSEAPKRGVAEHEGSDVASEGAHMSSSDEGMESDVDSDSHGEEGDSEIEEENENEDEDEEEEKEKDKKEDKEDESKSAIKWTEADQKNLMDLGSLELERNQRLENLIARRRARHNMRLMAERNLIDLDSADIPFNMPPISTARQNPFDLPYDPYDELLPIPGSAPSLMFPRRNPFDLPYEPNEEKPDLKGDGFQEEISSQQSKDPVFRRHESFSVGPSMLGGPRHDRLRPFFVLERLANEGTSYYPLERQLSEVSESKVSSVPDSESVCTILEDDEKKVSEHEADLETEISKVDTVSDHDEEKSQSASDLDEDQIHSSEHSDFDEQAESRNIHHDVAEIILGSAETHHEQSNIMERETSDMRKLHEEEYSDSDSSISSKEEKISDNSDNETMSISERKFDPHEESGTSSQPSFEELQIHARSVENDYHPDEGPIEDSFITAHPSLTESALNDLCGLVDDHPPEEPVYDRSPPSASRVPSFSSVSSDYNPEPGKNEEEVQDNAGNDNELEVYSESRGPADIHSTSDEIKTRTKEVGETSLHVAGEPNLLIPEVEIEGQNNPTISGSEFEDAILGPSSLPLDKNETADLQENVRSSVSSQENLDELHEDVKEAIDTRATDTNASLVEVASPTQEEVISAGMVEQHLPFEGRLQEEEEAQKHEKEASPQTLNTDIPISSFSTLSSGAVEYVETHSFNDDDVPQSEQDPVQPSVSNGEEESHLSQTMDIQVDSVDAVGQNVGSEDTTASASDRELTWSDKSVVEQSTLEPDEDHELTRAGPVSVVFSRNITFHEYHDAPEDSAELSCLTSDTSTSPVDSPEYKTPMVGEGSREEFFHDGGYEELDHVAEHLDQVTDLHAISQSPPEVIPEEADEIKEIDVGLLSELDTIGDFSVKEVVTDSNPGPSSIGSDIANEQVEVLQEPAEVEDVILPSTVQDQLAQESNGNSETSSDFAIVEPTSKEDLVYAMDQAAVESLGKSSESDGSSGEVKREVETEPSVSSVEDRYVDEKNGHLNNTPEKEEKEASGPKETITSDVWPIETQSSHELPEPSEPKEGIAMEVIPERVETPREAIVSGNVPESDKVVNEEAKAETAEDGNVQSLVSKEAPHGSGESIAEEKEKSKT